MKKTLQIISCSFFDRPTTLVAKGLLGKYIARKINGEIISLKITETEAYDGPLDLACHGRFGKTKKALSMFEPAGTIYVYLIYGMHWMFNIVTREKDFPAAVFIRGAQGLSGPARISKFLKIDKSLNGKIACKQNNLWFEDRKETINKKNIQKTSRIGIDYAGPIWSNKPYRFILKNHVKSRKIK
jgi:DNA-3-methyladenine glycosylase